jgi:signal transduction histidine kinase
MTEPGQTIQVRGTAWLNAATYLSIAVMGVIGLMGLPSLALRAAAAGLCLVYGLLYTFGYRAARTERDLTVYFTAQTAVVVGLLLTRSRILDAFVFLAFLLAIQAGIVYPPRLALRWIALLIIVTSAAHLWASGSNGLVAVAFNLTVFVLCGSYGNTVRESETGRRRNLRLLEDLQAAQSQLAGLAVAEERNRLARDLHDSAKQQAFAVSAQLGAARALLGRDPAAAAARLRQAEALADGLRQELGDVILDLRPAPPGRPGLAASLEDFAADWSRQSDIEVVVEAHGRCALPPPVAHTLFRIAQEALANVARHSRARTARVRLDCTDQSVSLTVQDDGQGFAPGQRGPGMGTQSMRERAASLPGGALTVESAPGQGTTVRVRCAVASENP